MVEAPQGSRKAFLVIGMHRSGTSAMARVLSLVGAHLPRDVMPAHESNPMGHWEPMPIAALNDQMLAAVDARWDSPFGPARNRRDRLPLDKFRPAARSVVREQYGDADLIVLKEPRVSLLADFWLTTLKEEGISPMPILMIRRPEEVAASLQRRNGMAPILGQILWSTYMLAAERHSREGSRLLCTYDRLIDEPQRVIDAVEDAFMLELPRRSWLSAHNVDDFVRPDQRHHGAQVGTKRFALLAPVARLADCLMAAGSGAALDVQVLAETAGWLQDLSTLISPMLAAVESRHATEQAELAQTLDYRTRQLSVAEGVGAERLAEINRRDQEIVALTKCVAELKVKLTAASL